MNQIIVSILFLGLFTVFGLLFASIGFYYLNKFRYFRTHGKRTTGRVIRREQSRSRRGPSVGERPVVWYEVEGRSYEFIRSFYSLQYWYRVNEEVPVYYLPAEPAKAYLVSRQEITHAWISAGIGATLLLVVLVASILLIIIS